MVPDYQLSLAIGKRGQNARLAARLTNFKIDIKPESERDAVMAELENPTPAVEEVVDAFEEE
ncbi:Transcription elongation protein nusA [Weissella viridescens]|uniref:Transcription elongation protein nusA n=1 Tax=Weissella viridescens TaxID=1629 RepID=A0A380P8F3_WEIVI|nr:Transcription elongation protein nusA [Weissella viridescens]